MIYSNADNSAEKKWKVMRLEEYPTVEQPFLEQLKLMLEWDEVIELTLSQTPQQSYRNSLDEVLLVSQLVAQLKKINPFLTDTQIDEVIRRIDSFQSNNLIENNQSVLNLLLNGTTVDKNQQTGDISPRVRYIDFENPANNHFVAISQFKIHIKGTDNYIIPDIVLFINGIPIGVVECKSPKVNDSINEAITQLLRYAEQENYEDIGVKELFYYNQLLIVTDRYEARFGTITTKNKNHFYKWLNPYPRTLEQIQEGDSIPHDQRRLVAGMLDKTNLLDLIRTFNIFSTDDKGNTIKILGRYQQFKAVNKAVERLLTKPTRDERSGIIWHTQGSGKSLTMMFMVRKMYQYTKLAGWKVIFLTDRTQLEDQLVETASAIGVNIKIAEWINKDDEKPNRSLKELIASDNSDLVMAMIHKFQERDLETIFPILNESDKILLMIDEAHRSQYTLLGANLDRAVPNASRIAYTGTPIDKTEQTFGDYIDTYTMREAIEDEVTLEIVYEGRTNNAEVPDKKGMDGKFEDVFSEYDIVQRLQILGFGTRDAYLEAESTIRAKAEDMVKHYAEHIFTNGFKAQVVAVSREAAVRYKRAIDDTITTLIEQLEHDNPQGIDIDLLRKLETAVIISGKQNDEKHFKEFTKADYHKKMIKRFKLGFNSVDEDDQSLDGNVGFIIVRDMLLTGFDAPIEQVMYLDKVIDNHNLLQAIARVNRVGNPNKTVGYVVDYVGVGHHLKKALENYEEREQKEIINTLSTNDDELNALTDANRQLKEFFEVNECTDFGDEDAFFELFYDEDLRYKYIVLFKKFVKALNNVYPKKEALDFIIDFNNYTSINALVEKHNPNENKFSMKGIPAKLRAIADEFLQSKGIEVKVKPISIIDEEFYKKVESRKREKTKAAEIEHAIRHYISINLDEDPALFASFSETLENILQSLKGNWAKIKDELEALRQTIINREKENTYGLNRKTQMPIFRLAKSEFFQKDSLSEDEISINVDITQNLFIILENELKLKGFWRNASSQNKLKAELHKLLLSERFLNVIPNVRAKYKDFTSKLLEWARKNHYKIVNE
jgi:type I restriction enzyme R subunit